MNNSSVHRSSFIDHRSAESYGAFAYAYDQALGRRFFRAARRMLARSLEQQPPREKTHLDLACGTGYAIEFFAQQGFASIGVDLSIPMLAMAKRRARRLVAADVRALPLRRTFARITCLYDSLNHMKDRHDLVAAFRAARGVMSHDSLFLFDMNHPEIYPEIWGSKLPFIASGEGFHLEIATKFRKRDGIAQALVTGWADVGGRRVDIRERHEQRAWSEAEIRSALDEAGLDAVSVENFDPYNEADVIEAPTVKLFFTVAPPAEESIAPAS